MPVGQRYAAAPRLPKLGEGFFDVVEPARFPKHVLRFRNQPWAERLGLGTLDEGEWEEHFARFAPLPGNLERPLALRYHGHQFMVYNPNLGDGRAFLFAELLDPVDGRLLDLGTKGSGRTPWSRDGDGRLTLKGGVREVLASEMLEALGVYTSKAMSLFETGESLYRGDEPSPTRSAILVRLGHSHVRIGTFERLAWHEDAAGTRRLLEFSIESYMPNLAGDEHDPAAAFYAEVCRRSARLVASWMVAGFVHGVLNSDNMNVTGESFDYGPYRFLPAYDPEFVAAYFDHGGLYAFGRQPTAVKFNLTCLAESLMPVSTAADLRPAYDAFEESFRAALAAELLERLGLESRGAEADAALAVACYDFLGDSRVGYDRFFFDWYGGAASERRALDGPASALYRGESFKRLRTLLDGRRPTHRERLAQPYFQRDAPCSLLIDEIEAIWDRIAAADDWSAFGAKIVAIREMGAAYGRSSGGNPAPMRSTKFSE